MRDSFKKERTDHPHARVGRVLDNAVHQQGDGPVGFHDTANLFVWPPSVCHGRAEQRHSTFQESGNVVISGSISELVRN
jgi:hypothetical protein